MIDLYTSNLKNQEFDKEAPQNFSCLERATIAGRQGASEDKNSDGRPTLSKIDYSSCLCIVEELILGQKKKLLSTAKRIVPHITEDDLLQPNDFPALELHPHFRYEEGILDGLQVARMAILAKESECLTM